MAKNLSVSQQRTYISTGIISGVIIGGLIGMLTGFLHRAGTLIIPGLSNIFNIIPLNEIIIGTLLGIAIGGILGGVLSLYTNEAKDPQYSLGTNTLKQDLYDNSETVTLQIKEEQLSIAKKWMETADVKVYRETFTEDKNFTLPIKREELVIERKDITSTKTDHNDIDKEVIRIPISEEQIQFTKHKVALEDVSIYKQQIKDIHHIEETLKREEAKIKISGTAKVRDQSNSKRS